ncbi:putative proline-rich receptor-like protein kinase PERK6 [Neltuma alba]|uniref:putative proline-rich receptor-like protein kinase PERK6 n=1 Tax=Neltuma alba TaxID=207710 RepID=UPI0010A4BB63|nr:putative proline-rich receptor-like protein kinase PERK6 [Prosopis alba]
MAQHESSVGNPLSVNKPRLQNLATQLDAARGRDMMLVYEFIPNGSLESHLHGRDTETIDWETRKKIAIGSARGLEYLHDSCKPRIIHLDIKPANILLLEDFQPKVLLYISLELRCLAPEYTRGRKATEKADVFAFGVVLLELITGRKPSDFTDNTSEPELLAVLNSEDRNFEALADPRLQNHYNPEEMFRMVSCAASGIHQSSARRPQMSQVAMALEGWPGLDNDPTQNIAPRRCLDLLFEDGSVRGNTRQKKQATNKRKTDLPYPREESAPWPQGQKIAGRIPQLTRASQAYPLSYCPLCRSVENSPSNLFEACSWLRQSERTPHAAPFGSSELSSELLASRSSGRSV